MLTTEETIQISETTTSCRVKIGSVNFEATLDERYQQHCAVEDSKKKASLPAPTATPVESSKPPRLVNP